MVCRKRDSRSPERTSGFITTCVNCVSVPVIVGRCAHAHCQGEWEEHEWSKMADHVQVSKWFCFIIIKFRKYDPLQSNDRSRGLFRRCVRVCYKCMRRAAGEVHSHALLDAIIKCWLVACHHVDFNSVIQANTQLCSMGESCFEANCKVFYFKQQRSLDPERSFILNCT